MGVVALLLAFIACTDEIAEVQSSELKQIVITAPDFETETGSRTNFQITSSGAEFSWAANDTVGIFPNEGAQAYFPMTSGAGTKSANFTGGGWALKDASTYAAYYPFIGNFYLNKNAIPVDYTGQVQIGDASTVHLGAYDYMAAAPSTPNDGSVNFAFKHLGALIQLKLTLPQASTLNSVTLIAESEAFAIKGTIDVMASAPSIASVTSAKEIKLNLLDVKTTEANQVVTLYMMLPPADLSAQTLKAVVVSDKGNQEVILDSKNFLAGKAYALSGSLKDPNGGAVVGNGTYKDGVVSIATAGTMKKLLGDDYLNITSLKVVGPINGDDVYYLRKMLGGPEFSQADWGKLTSLDLSESSIIEGGEWYYDESESSGDEYYTSNNMIGSHMFSKCVNLQKILLPDDIISIGDYAFLDCTFLESINIPDKVIKIGNRAFDGSETLSSVYIDDLSAWCKITFESSPLGHYMYGSKLYLNNTELTELVIPEDITEIKDNSFAGCSSITKVSIGDNVTSIGNEAFSGCHLLKSINISDKVTIIGNSAFSQCTSLVSINLPNRITSIASAVFYFCTSLVSINIPDGVTSIGNYAFCYCESLTSVTIGKNTASIGKNAFRFCNALTSFYCHSTIPPVINDDRSSEKSFDIYGEKTTLYVPMRCGTKYKSSNWNNYFNNIIEMD